MTAGKHNLACWPRRASYGRDSQLRMHPARPHLFCSGYPEAVSEGGRVGRVPRSPLWRAGAATLFSIRAVPDPPESRVGPAGLRPCRKSALLRTDPAGQPFNRLYAVRKHVIIYRPRRVPSRHGTNTPSLFRSTSTVAPLLRGTRRGRPVFRESSNRLGVWPRRVGAARSQPAAAHTRIPNSYRKSRRARASRFILLPAPGPWRRTRRGFFPTIPQRRMFVAARKPKGRLHTRSRSVEPRAARFFKIDSTREGSQGWTRRKRKGTRSPMSRGRCSSFTPPSTNRHGEARSAESPSKTAYGSRMRSTR